jgi:hypothetical protein
MSLPALKARSPSPDSTTVRTLSSLLISYISSFMRWSISTVIALSFAGRSSTRCAT